MLIRFVITNFRSYGQETEFNMLPSQNVRRNEWHLHNDASDVSVLRTAVIYGANGAGKSCLIRAIGRLQAMVAHGTLPPAASRDANKYTGAKEPVTLEIEFKTASDQYSYGVSYCSGTCVEEWLYSTKRTPKCIFKRKSDRTTGKTKISLQPTKKGDAKNKMLVTLLEENILKGNELLLSKYDVVKETQMKDAYMWIVTQMHVIYPETHSTSIFDNRYSNPLFKQQSEKLITALDLGIDELMLKDEDLESFKMSISEWPELVQGVEKIVRKLSKTPDKDMEAMVEASAFTISIRREGDKYFVRRIKSVHKVGAGNYDFELKEESDGTQRIFDFLPVVQEVNGMTKTYIIDELDRSLHPSLVKALVERIVTDKNMKGQLIFTTHDAGLLNGNIFRNDEIWFTEKDRETQNTHIYTLDEFKPRTDLNLEKGYLNGRFGAIPFLAKLNELNWE